MLHKNFKTFIETEMFTILIRFNGIISDHSSQRSWQIGVEKQIPEFMGFKAFSNLKPLNHL